MLVRCGSSYTICTEKKDVTSPTLDPELEPTSMPTPKPMPEHNIAPEPESNSVSDQVSESAILSVPVGVLVEFKGMDWSPKAEIS